MARQRLRKYLVYSHLQTHLFKRRGKAASHWQKDASLSSSWDMYYVLGGGGSGNLLTAESEDLDNLLRASDIHVKRLTHKEVAQGGKLLFPCADGSLKSSSIFLHLHAVRCPPRETLRKMKKQEEDTIFQEEKRHIAV